MVLCNLFKFGFLKIRWHKHYCSFDKISSFLPENLWVTRSKWLSKNWNELHFQAHFQREYVNFLPREYPFLRHFRIPLVLLLLKKEGWNILQVLTGIGFGEAERKRYVKSDGLDILVAVVLAMNRPVWSSPASFARDVPLRLVKILIGDDLRVDHVQTPKFVIQLFIWRGQTRELVLPRLQMASVNSMLNLEMQYIYIKVYLITIISHSQLRGLRARRKCFLERYLLWKLPTKLLFSLCRTR